MTAITAAVVSVLLLAAIVVLDLLRPRRRSIEEDETHVLWLVASGTTLEAAIERVLSRKSGWSVDRVQTALTSLWHGGLLDVRTTGPARSYVVTRAGWERLEVTGWK